MTVMKRKVGLCAALALCCSLILPTMASAGEVPVSIEALLRGGVNGVDDQTEVPANGLIVKTSGALDFARKSYIQFDVTGEDVAGEDATLSFELLFAFPQEIRTWGLDQAYPGFSALETWDNAQANDVPSAMQLLTVGANTATGLADTTISGGAIGDIISIPLGNLSAHTFGNLTTLGLTGLADLGQNGGLRIKYGTAKLTFGAIPEPASMGLALIAGLGMLCGRRRS